MPSDAYGARRAFHRRYSGSCSPPLLSRRYELQLRWRSALAVVLQPSLSAEHAAVVFTALVLTSVAKRLQTTAVLAVCSSWYQPHHCYLLISRFIPISLYNVIPSDFVFYVDNCVYRNSIFSTNCTQRYPFIFYQLSYRSYLGRS